MKKILKWLGIGVAGLVALVVLLIVFVPSSNKSFEEGREAGRASTQNQEAEYSEEELRGIYNEVLAAEDKAMAKAEEQCPTDATSDALYDKWLEMTEQEQMEYMQGCIELSNNLSEQYRSEVLGNYGLSSEEWKDISSQILKEDFDLE